MENIIEPNLDFDFSQLSLKSPVSIQGGAYFTKLEYLKKSIFIQTPKIKSKQGFIKSGKKYFIDLMFDKNAEQLIEWLEKLEESCQNLIYEKSEQWFQNSLTKESIESAFNPIIKIYKSGNFYLVRSSIKNSIEGKPVIKIYNENQVELNIDDVNENTDFLSILEIQGIKFTTRNFQIEIELKQVMVLDKEPQFDICMIKKNTKQIKEVKEPDEFENSEISQLLNQNQNKINENKTKETELFSNNFNLNQNENQNENQNKNQNENKEKEQENLPQLVELNDLIEIDNINNDKLINEENLDDLKIEFEDLDNNSNNILNIKEFNGSSNIESSNIESSNIESSNTESSNTINLRKQYEVYQELYKTARKKAKEAKKNAIIAYLEAKNIRHTHKLDNLDTSDSEFDDEIDEVSDSELEYFK